jgi:NOL1/NOP2/fmu family ribosome biogenesis protein
MKPFSRTGSLLENCIKWGASNILVTNNDPKDFCRLENYFDVMVIDAPCSGSGLFRKEPEAIREWSADQVRVCSLRQQRILADAWPALRNEGILVYSTCSYSKEENEEILDWVLENFNCKSLPIQIKDEWNIVKSVSDKFKATGYRFYPDKTKGEGLFVACLKKQEGNYFHFSKKAPRQSSVLTSREKYLLNDFLDTDELHFIKGKDLVWGLPEKFMNDYIPVHKYLFIKKAGILLGKMGSGELIPNHELALSRMIRANFPSIELGKEEALKYLRREDIDFEKTEKGWKLVKYSGQNLGWLKVLDKRANNYYPMEWRILKQKG